MISIWYPAVGAASTAIRRPWLSPNLAGVHAETLAQVGVSPDNGLGWASSHGEVGATAQAHGGRRPVVVFSPGMGMPRELNTAHAEDLASHGFIVVTMSHTYESSGTEFPGERLERAVLPPAPGPDEVESQIAVALETRVADTRFVLDELADIAAGDNPDVDAHPLPEGLSGVLDLSKIVMFGHSLGGATAAQAMHDDRRILAAADLDGGLWGSVVTDGLDRPFMLVSGAETDRAAVPGWREFWADSPGPKVRFRLDGARHQSFCDNQHIAAALVDTGVLPDAVATRLVGSIDPKVSNDLQNAYLRTFFDTALGRYDRLVQGADALLNSGMVPVP